MIAEIDNPDIDINFSQIRQKKLNQSSGYLDEEY